MADDNTETSVSAFSKRMRDAQASGGAVGPYGSGGGEAGGFKGFQDPSLQPLPRVRETAPSRPTQADLEKIVDTEAASVADAAWDDPKELAVHALIHRAWAMELERQGWNVSEIGSAHIKSLRLAQAAIRLIAKREPIA